MIEEAFLWDTFIKKIIKFRKFIKIFHCYMTTLKNKKWLYLFIRTTLRKENTGQLNFKNSFEFHSFSKMFNSGMTRPRNTNMDCFRNIQNFKILVKNLTVAWPDSGTSVRVFLFNVGTQELF